MPNLQEQEKGSWGPGVSLSSGKLPIKLRRRGVLLAGALEAELEQAACSHLQWGLLIHLSAAGDFCGTARACSHPRTEVALPAWEEKPLRTGYQGRRSPVVPRDQPLAAVALS